jgi:hypothetical protein
MTRVMITCPVCGLDLQFEDEGSGSGWPKWICPGCFTPGPYPEVEQEISWDVSRVNNDEPSEPTLGERVDRVIES